MTTQSTAQLTSEGVLEIGLPRSYKSASERSGIRFHVRGAGRDVSLTGRKRTWPEDDKVVYPGLATELPVDGEPNYVVVATDRAGSEDQIPVTTTGEEPGAGAVDEASRAQAEAARTAALASRRAVAAREAAGRAGDARRVAEAAAEAAHALRDGSGGAADKAADLVATFSATAADCAERSDAAREKAEQAADDVSELSAKVKEGAPADASMRAAAKAAEAFEHADEAEKMAAAAAAAADSATAAQQIAQTRALVDVPAGPAATPMTQGIVVHCQPEQWYEEGGVQVECGPEPQAQQEQKPQEQQAQAQQAQVAQQVQQGGGSEPEPDACCNVSAERTACGFVLTLPKPANPKDVKVVLDLPCKDMPGWMTRQAGESGYELLPPPGLELPTGPFWAKVTYPCNQSKYCANVQIPGVQAHAGGDGCCDIFRVPLRVDTTGSVAGGGTVAGGDLGPWAGKLIERFLPGISRTTEPTRIREAFAKLLPPSPNGLGIRAATLATAGAGLAITPVTWPSTATAGWAGGAGAGWPQGWAATPAGAATALPVGSMATAGGWPPSWGPGGGGWSPGAITGLQPQVRTAVSGPFALFRTSADVLETYALTALRDLRPLLQTADLDLVESERALTEDAMLGVITEFRRENGPEFGAAQVFMDALVAHVIPTGVVSPLGAALGISAANAQSAEDYENIGRFQALEDWVRQASTLFASWTPGADPRADLIEVRGLLAVVVEKADQLEDELTIAHVDEQQRRTIEITPTGLKVVTLAGLLDWIRVESGQRLPSLLDRAAAQTAGDAVQTILTDQQTYVDTVRAINAFPWTHLPVSGAAQDLSAQLAVTATRAGNL